MENEIADTNWTSYDVYRHEISCKYRSQVFRLANYFHPLRVHDTCKNIPQSNLSRHTTKRLFIYQYISEYDQDNVIHIQTIYLRDNNIF